MLHGSDLTISVAVNAECLPGASGQDVLSSYRQILSGVVASLKWVGVEAVQGSISTTRQSHRVVNCFDRVAGCDLVDGKTGRKILGSAQRRMGTALLQQMSMPLAVLPNLGDFFGVLKSAFQEALEIEAWLTIDTFGPVWYTEQEESEGTRRWRVKFLTCDDEKHIVRLIQVNLERQGYEVITAFNGLECLEKVKEDRPDLIVLDVMMPEMTGFEVLEKLKKNPETESIPVIMLTARAQDSDVLRGWQSGVECYLTKPFNPMELIAFVKRIFSMEDGIADEKRYTI